MPSFDVYSVHFGNKDLADSAGYIRLSRKSQQVLRTLAALCTCVHRRGWQTQTFHWGLKIEKLSGDHVLTSAVAHMKAYVQRRTRSHLKACVCPCVISHKYRAYGSEEQKLMLGWVSLSIAHNFEFWEWVSYWPWRPEVHWVGPGICLSLPCAGTTGM